MLVLKRCSPHVKNVFRHLCIYFECEHARAFVCTGSCVWVSKCIYNFGVLDLNSDHLSWQQLPLPNEPYCRPLPYVLRRGDSLAWTTVLDWLVSKHSGLRLPSTGVISVRRQPQVCPGNHCNH